MASKLENLNLGSYTKDGGVIAKKGKKKSGTLILDMLLRGNG